MAGVVNWIPFLASSRARSPARIDVTDYGLSSGAAVLALGIDDGDGNSYFALGDGLDYVYMVGLEKANVSASDFIVS